MPQILDLNTVEAGLRKHSTDHLLDILQYSQHDYQPQVIPIVISILQSRNVQQSRIDEAITKYNTFMQSAKVSTFKPKEKGLNKVLLWIMFIIALGLLGSLKKQIGDAVINSLSQQSK